MDNGDIFNQDFFLAFAKYFIYVRYKRSFLPTETTDNQAGNFFFTSHTNVQRAASPRSCLHNLSFHKQLAPHISAYGLAARATNHTFPRLISSAK